VIERDCTCDLWDEIRCKQTFLCVSGYRRPCPACRSKLVCLSSFLVDRY
jgi:hypothetical protein